MSKQKPKRRKPKHIGPTKRKKLIMRQPTKYNQNVGVRYRNTRRQRTDVHFTSE